MTTLHIVWRIIRRDNGGFFFAIECPHGTKRPGSAVKECLRSIWTRPPEGIMWNWDGDMRAPTIRPSISCQDSRCNRHFTMVEGKAVV